MRKPIHIAAPWPTLEERVKDLHVSKIREKELQALVDQFKAILSNREDVHVNSIDPAERRKRASAA